MGIILFIMWIIFLDTGSASAQERFVIDMTPDEVLEEFWSVDSSSRVGDLAVGDHGYIYTHAVCRTEEGIGILNVTKLQDPPGRYSAKFLVERHADDLVSLSLMVDDENDSFDFQNLSRIFWRIIYADPEFGTFDRRCEDVLADFPQAEIFAVASIDGYSTLSEWWVAFRSGRHPLSQQVGFSAPPDIRRPQDNARVQEDLPTSNETPTHRWVVQRGRAEIDDSPWVSAFIFEDGSTGRRTFRISCIEGRTAAIFGFDEYLRTERDDRIRAEYRLDREPAERDRWRISVSNEHTGYWGTGAITFIRRLLDHDRIFVRVTERNGTQHTARFNLDGLREVSGEIAIACGWNVPAFSSNRIRLVQIALQELGFYNGSIDGQWGPMSRTALTAYQEAYGISATGILTEWIISHIEQSRLQ